jgi:hypothetical protein
VSFLPGFPDGSFGWAKVLPHLPNAAGMPKLFVEYVGMGDASSSARRVAVSFYSQRDGVHAGNRCGVRSIVAVVKFPKRKMKIGALLVKRKSGLFQEPGQPQLIKPLILRRAASDIPGFDVQECAIRCFAQEIDSWGRLSPVFASTVTRIRRLLRATAGSSLLLCPSFLRLHRAHALQPPSTIIEWPVT